MRKVISKDGTPIAFDQSGKGPALILVAGATATRLAEASLAAALAPDFTVFAYDRRGRGNSGDTPPYAVEREVEDIDALIIEAGGSAFVFGHSSGAVLALEAARLLPTRIRKLALYEPPFSWVVRNIMCFCGTRRKSLPASCLMRSIASWKGKTTARLTKCSPLH